MIDRVATEAGAKFQTLMLMGYWRGFQSTFGTRNAVFWNAWCQIDDNFMELIAG